ncbi:hypothetical protein [Arthrobacter ginkgonis]
MTIAALALAGAALPAQAATPATRVTALEATVGDDRGVRVTLKCAGSRACGGTVRLKSSALTTSAKSYSISAGKSKTLTLTLSTAQYKKLKSKGQLKSAVVISQKEPTKTSATKPVTVKPATAKLALASGTLVFGTDGKAVLTLKCTGTATCKGSVTPTIAGKAMAKVSYSIRTGGAQRVTLALSAAQKAKLSATASGHTLKVAETAPEKLAYTRTITAQLAQAPATETPGAGTPGTETPGTETPGGGDHGHGGTEPEAPVYSVAYTERNWVPTEYDTCPAELHASYNATGPDGKIYPTWHPAQVVDPATGQLCSFGHEHGADPATSEIYDWVVNYLAPEGSTNKGLPFGYASEELNTYAHHHSGMSMRHEDNGGHKVFVANNVKLIDADREWVTTTDAAGNTSTVTCDYLIKQHQGSWSPDATSNNAHELIYASKCSDGTEIITTMLSRFGNANEFFQNCGAKTIVSTVGSTLPAGDGGARRIPDADCLKAAATDGVLTQWDLYEVWEGDNKLTTADGTVLAEFDPWFGLRNPSRYYDPANGTATTNGVSRPLDLAWGDKAVKSDLWGKVGSAEPYDYRDPRSPFNGATRDFYLNQNRVTAAATLSSVYTDPYGGNASDATFEGAIKQHLVAGSATADTTLAQWRSGIVEYGTGNGVHAPN